jgi:S-adenosylmethionine decarboxylase
MLAHQMERIGCHWIFDGYGAEAARLDDEALLRQALEGLPDLLGLRKVAPAQSFRHEAGRERTVAGIVLLAESHLSLHAFPAQGVVHGDLFSCKPFDVEGARGYLTRVFGLRGFHEELLERRTPGRGKLDLSRHGA